MIDKDVPAVLMLPPGPRPSALPAPVAVAATVPVARVRRSVYVVAVLALVVAGLLGYTAGARRLRTESHYLLMQALGEVRQADADVEAVVGVVDAGPDAGGGDAARSAQPAAARAAAHLRAALTLMSKAQPELKDEDRPLAAAVRRSVLGRSEILGAATELLPLQARAADALLHAEAARSHAASAADLRDEAAVRFNTHTKKGVAESTKLTERAESEFAWASAEIEAAAAAMPEAALAPIAEYVTERRRLAAESRRVDALWLAGRVDEANRALAQLAAREAPLDARAAKLPKTPAVPVTAAYARLGKRAGEVFRGARQLALAGDARLRELAAAQPSE